MSKINNNTNPKSATSKRSLKMYNAFRKKYLKAHRADKCLMEHRKLNIELRKAVDALFANN